jgi:ribose transport system substrate-binding protein
VRLLRYVLLSAFFSFALTALLASGAAAQRTVSRSTSRPFALPNVSYAQAQVAAASKVPAFADPGPPVDAAKAKGMTIFNIPITSAIPFCAAVDKSEATIAKLLGIHFIEFPTQGQPSQWVQGINEAVAQKANLIILQCGVADNLLQPQIAQATKAHIPVIDTHHDALGTPPMYGLTAKVNVASHQQLRLVVDSAIAAKQGHVNAVILTSNDVAPSPGIVSAMENEFATRCGSSCKYRVINVPVADWATKMQNEVQSALVADPTINYILPIYDGMSQFAIPGVLAAGKKSSVSIATSDGSPFVLKDIQQGNVVAFDVGKSPDWVAWANMDQALRVLTGMKPVSPSFLYYPYRAWDSSDISEAGNPPGYGGYGNAYIAGYKKLWGLK